MYTRNLPGTCCVLSNHSKNFLKRSFTFLSSYISKPIYICLLYVFSIKFLSVVNILTSSGNLVFSLVNFSVLSPLSMTGENCDNITTWYVRIYYELEVGMYCKCMYHK